MDWRISLTAALIGLGSAAAWAECSHVDFLHDLAQRESKLDPSARNPFGYVGLFQMGEAALQDAGYYRGDLTRKNDWTGSWTGLGGIHSLSDFYARPDVQVQAIVGYHNRMVAQIKRLGLDRSIGTSVGGVPVTFSGLIAGAHLVGMGNLQTFINSAGSAIPRDGNGVPITAYIAGLGGCAVGATAPTFAAVIAAKDGAGVGTAPVIPPVIGMPAAPAPIAIDPGSAFTLGSGHPPRKVQETVGVVIATLLMLWLLWMTQASFLGWSKGRTSLFHLQSIIVRGSVVLCVLLTILH